MSAPSNTPETQGCDGSNATPPSPAVAPGADLIDVTAAAQRIGAQGVDPRLRALLPEFDAPFFQAGLAGYSDAAMRLIARSLGAPFCVTEALLDRTLLAGGRGFAKADLGELEDNLPFGSADHPLAGQLMGSDPDTMAAAAVKMIEQGARADREYRTAKELRATRAERTFEVIDVNLACPVKKIERKARGGHWLREPQGAIEILRAVREALPSDVICSVKMRRAFDDTEEHERAFFQIFDKAYELGYAWVTVHGRSVKQKYVGPSRWTFLRDLVRSRGDRIIFGSGDVWGAREIFQMLEYTGVAAVSVARGCIGNPWVFRQARQMMRGEAPMAPTIEEQRDVLLQHFEYSRLVNGERLAGRLMRKFGIRFAAHHPRGDEVKRAFVRVETQDDWRQVVAQFYGAESQLLAESV
ncbi:MAG: tRNA dihydrouridine synthase [Phycisphaerales bacterium]